jgi:hypothetical protein
LVLSVPVAIFTDIKLYNEIDNSSGICIEDWPQNGLRQAYSSSLFVVTYCIPLLVLIITYGHIVLILDVKPPGEEYGNLMRRRRIVKRKVCASIFVPPQLYMYMYKMYSWIISYVYIFRAWLQIYISFFNTNLIQF